MSLNTLRYNLAVITICAYLYGCAGKSQFETKNHLEYVVVFPESYSLPYKVADYTIRYSPTSSDIALAEQVIEDQLAALNHQEINQGFGCPTIHRNLGNYAQQYIGFMNEKGEKIVWTNFIWKDYLPKYFKDEIVFVLDGCSYYWSIEVNLSQKKASHLLINGSA